MKNRVSFFLLLSGAVLIAGAGRSAAVSQKKSGAGVVHPRTEYRVNPLGIDVEQPRLSWEILSERRGTLQSAYEIQASVTAAGLGRKGAMIWETGKVESDRSIQVRYEGPPPGSGERVYWRVRVWTGDGEPSPWSDPAWWEAGLAAAAWQAEWIAPPWEEDTLSSQPCPYLRREFSVGPGLVRARLYATAHGLYHMRLNGRAVADWLLTPGWTSYNKRLQYQTYDVGGLLRRGENCLGAILGDGWYRGYLGWQDKRNNYGTDVALLAELHLRYRDGHTEVIRSDGSWLAATGPILSSDIYHGETCDARLEMEGWDAPGFAAGDWAAVTTAVYPKNHLIAQNGPAVRPMLEVEPVAIIRTPRGETVYDFGQNMVGHVRLRVSGPAGTEITIRHAEVLDREGNFYTGNLRVAKQTVRYILKGEGVEIYEPRFTFQGFRYAAVEGLPGEPSLTHLTGIVTYSDMERTGTFSCSDSLITRLQENIVWGQRGNFLDVPTDCPQRDERMGWTGDAQVFAPTACFNMDVAAFFTKWLGDLAADQQEDGAVPWVVPDVLGGAGSAAWADAAVIVPWVMYQSYGDVEILRRQYDSMRRWVECMRGRAGDDLLWTGGSHFGDWLAYATTRSDYPGATTEKDLIATAFFAHSTELLARSAAILGRGEEAAAYAGLAGRIKAAFCDEFVTPNGRLVSHTQTAYALALAFNLLPEERRQQAADYLAADVRKFGHLTTGFVGTPLLCPVLSDYGHTDLAYRLLMRRAYPSWLYPVTMGATTIWERWDGIRTDGSFQDEGMNSFNHYAYGAIGQWLYSRAAGLRIDPEHPGYKHILFHPEPGGGLTRASASLHTLYGAARSAWKIEDGTLVYEVMIPPNSTGSVVLEHTTVDDVTLDSHPLGTMRPSPDCRQEADRVVVTIGSGAYTFRCPWSAE
ncbi:family 78 glycoside hydrolase catalytic domain [bacterium]|nr:family 78 glycoside hydrolase catalytic domain [bacterium]